MVFALKFTVAGEQQVARQFSRFGDEVRDARPLFTAIARDMDDIEDRQFETQGSSGSGGWRALSPRYAAWKSRNFPGRKLLVQTGALRDSLVGKGKGHIEKIGKRDLVIGTSVPHAIYHQMGTSRGLPVRKPIQLSDKDKQGWSKITQVFLVASARKAFGVPPWR